jgi:glycosyltransferase 2 family protein
MASCRHVDQAEILSLPDPVGGCQDCLREGKRWMHLRMCQTCGHIGCCDNSPGRHATAHYRETGHPIIRSAEPGESWSWCYVDEMPVEVAGTADVRGGISVDGYGDRSGGGSGSDGDSGDMPDELNPRHIRRRLIELAVFGALVAGAISVLPGLGDVRERFAHASAGWIIAAGVLELFSCLSYVAAFRGVFCRGMGWRFSYEIGMAEQATNVLLPAGGAGGLALGAWALRQGGMDTRHIARRSVAFFLITSAPNFLTAALFGLLLATGVLPGRDPLAATIPLAALATLAIAGVLSLPRLIDWRRERRAPASADAGIARGRVRSVLRATRNAASDGVRDSVDLLVHSRDPLIVGGSLGYMVFDLLALAAAFAAFGGAPPLGPFVFAYVIGQLGGLIPLPGGIGGTDGGLIGALVLYGTPLSQATAAVLAYRAFQLGVPALLGAAAFVQMRRTLARHPAPAALCHPLTQPLQGGPAPASEQIAQGA